MQQDQRSRGQCVGTPAQGKPTNGAHCTTWSGNAGRKGTMEGAVIATGPATVCRLGQVVCGARQGTPTRCGLHCYRLQAGTCHTCRPHLTPYT